MDHRVLLFRGPVGVGKSTLAAAFGDVLTARDVPHAVLDLDALCQSWPQFGPWNDSIRMSNLRAVCSVYQSHGISNFVLAGPAETPESVDTLAAATGADRITICGVYAGLDTIRARLQTRIRTDVPFEWYESRAAELLAQLRQDGLDDLTVETDGKTPMALATEVAGHLGWGVEDDLKPT